MIRAVLFDRDGTLVADTPRQLLLTPAPDAREALARLRRAALRVGVVTNQPAIGEGRIAAQEMHAAHRDLEQRIGAIDGWFVCPHRASDGCACRKPQPGLVFQAAQAFGVEPHECAVIGDIGSDVEAALRAGAHAVLVPTPITLREEVEPAPVVCRDLLEAVDYVLGALVPS